MTKLQRMRCILILDYLKENKIIGKEKAISGLKLVNSLKVRHRSYFKDDFDTSDLRRYILKLRRNEIPDINVTRMIGSSHNGYFLVPLGENGLEYQKNFAISVLTTAIKGGVPKEIFYNVLNSLDNKQAIERKQIITTRPYERRETHIYSDDLLE